MMIFIYDRSVYFSSSFISFLRDSVQDIEISYFSKEEELIRDALQEKPSLIILDIKYYSHFNFQLIQQLKDLYRPVVIVCMYLLVDELMNKKCLEYGADYVLDKYMEYERIIEIVNSIKSNNGI
ncbi:MAG TPA: hypothetical protein VFV46_11320 [Lacibacter sp.]|nr:hypothetical protein [Lacibacter sp.]